MARSISNSDDIIDSRDVIARIDELKTELEDACEGEGNDTPFDQWVVAMADNDLGTLQDAATEYLALVALADEASSSPDWEYGEALIRDSYFRDYAQELADDIGAVKADAGWPNIYIDWDAAADALKQDYMSVEFDGVTYWIRG